MIQQLRDLENGDHFTIPNSPLKDDDTTWVLISKSWVEERQEWEIILGVDNRIDTLEFSLAKDRDYQVDKIDPKA